MAQDLFSKALAEAEKGLPEAFQILPAEIKKTHARMIVTQAYQKAVHYHGQGITDIAKLAKFFTIAYVSSATAEAIIRTYVLKI